SISTRSSEHWVSQLRGNAKGSGLRGPSSTMTPLTDKEAGMNTAKIGMDEMLRRVARFKDLKPSRKAFLDSLIPGHERELFNVLGRGATEDTTPSPAITAARDFNPPPLHAQPGQGAARRAGARRGGSGGWEPG